MFLYTFNIYLVFMSFALTCLQFTQFNVNHCNPWFLRWPAPHRAVHTPTHCCCITRILRWRAWLNNEMLVLLVLSYAFIWTMLLDHFFHLLVVVCTLWCTQIDIFILPACASSAWLLTMKIYVGGWCFCTHLMFIWCWWFLSLVVYSLHYLILPTEIHGFCVDPHGLAVK